MRKSFAALTVLGLVALALTGCTVAAPVAFDGAACDRTSSSGSVDDLATVSGDVGTTPDVSVSAPAHVTTTSYRDVVTGDGLALTASSQIAVVDFALYNGETGEELYASAFDGDLSRATNLALLQEQLPGIAAVLQCATVGTRVLAAISPDDFGADTLTSLGLDDDASIVAVVDLIDAKLPQAEGTLKYNDARGMPTVVRAPDGRPGIIVPGSDAPTDLTTQVLIEGDGAALDADTPFWVQYTEVGWDSKEVVSTTWDSNPTGVLLSSGQFPGFAEALEGKTIGSQVLIVVPEGYTDPNATDGTEGTTAANVYVVDILGTAEVSAQ